MIFDIFSDSFIQSNIIKNRKCILVPIFDNLSNHYSHYNSNILYFIIYDISSNRNHRVINISDDSIGAKHNLDELIELMIDNDIEIYTLHSIELYNLNFPNNRIIDINTILYTLSEPDTAHIINVDNIIKSSNGNMIVDIVKAYNNVITLELIESLNDFKEYNSDTFKFYNFVVLYNLYRLERNGIYIDVDEFKKYNSSIWDKHIIDNVPLIYSKFNPYTPTSRPSNSFNNYNFNAIQKNDHSRSPIKSRFGSNGILVEFDYSSFHLTLIAMLVDYKIDNNVNWHTYLGKQYFNTNELSEEQYNESKKLNFQYLYGSIPEKHRHIPFLSLAHELKMSLESVYNSNGYIESYKGRKLYPDSKYKTFNYYLQSLEFEIIMELLDAIFAEIEHTDIYPILYVYDSLLFDIKMTDFNLNVLKKVKNILENSNIFNISYKTGTSYDTLT